MEAQELRIGNYAYGNNNKVAVISLIDDETGNKRIRGWHTGKDKAFGASDEVLKPIPLTEEWLIKFGFTAVKSTYEHAETFDFTHGKCHIDMADQRISFMGLGDCDYSRIDYVHQLQNLYFAFTKEELIYSLT